MLPQIPSPRYLDWDYSNATLLLGRMNIEWFDQNITSLDCDEHLVYFLSFHVMFLIIPLSMTVSCLRSIWQHTFNWFCCSHLLCVVTVLQDLLAYPTGSDINEVEELLERCVDRQWKIVLRKMDSVIHGNYKRIRFGFCRYDMVYNEVSVGSRMFV